MSLVNNYQTFRPNLGSSSVVVRLQGNVTYMAYIHSGATVAGDPVDHPCLLLERDPVLQIDQCLSQKDRVPFQQKAGVIYRIPCNGCPRVYVGQTGRTLAQRLKEHKRALVSGHLAQSAVAEHAAEESHDIDWEGATVMDVQQQYHQRCLLESWHIRSELNTMNRDEGNLPPVYDLLVRQLRSSD